LKERLVGENKKCKFFTTPFCGEYKGYTILIAEFKKSKERTYIALKDNEIKAENETLDGIGIEIDLLKCTGY